MGTSPVPRANECDILAADRGDHVRVEACRPLDLATAPEVDAALRGALNGGRAVELDLRRISALGSSGINLLLRVSRRSRDRGATAQRHEGLKLAAVARYLPVVLGTPNDAVVNPGGAGEAGVAAGSRPDLSS